MDSNFQYIFCCFLQLRRCKEHWTQMKIANMNMNLLNKLRVIWAQLVEFHLSCVSNILFVFFFLLDEFVHLF